MKTNLLNANLLKLTLLSMLSITACKQAGFQVLKPGLVNPNNFDGEKSMAPTARVEVIDRGVSVTWVYAGTRVDVKPSIDTLDGDYINKDKCENPGIIAADYDLGTVGKPTIKREGCSELATKSQLFDKVGDYVISMTVKSQDNETASASMTLRVIDRKTPADQVEGGFAVHAKPILAQINQAITFTGICELKGRLTIDWDYADSSKGAGVVTQHAYSKAGQYVVKATCTNESGKKLIASMSVVVTTAKPPIVPDAPIVTPGTNPNIPKIPNCDPTQGPCQTAGQLPQGGKQVPDSTDTVWYYDPYCKCYIK